MAIPPSQFYVNPNHPSSPTPAEWYFMETVFVDAAKERKGKFVAVSPQKFLEKYLPEHLGMPQVNHASFTNVSGILSNF
ncbi:hypothetical protein BT96DRAFT_1003844 [Gymnopus androsaceus JB14]|uniref:Uncharacterized protein n=1 Tax=Gymnopus androsaceus JB14 TaxID=1447944 RepID=A0A6A4GT08_9AGAR|nr:hypothetical protein BT96DRAFT_1003844 [Gymnopus androsaceus JB14]